MKAWQKNFALGFVVIVFGCGLLALFFIKPELLLLLCLFAAIYGFLYLCCIIGEKIRESYFYENLVWYMKRMLNKGKKKGE